MGSVVVRAGGRRVRYLLLTGCLILGVLGLGAVEAHAATPSSLAGETFTTTNQQLRGSTLSGTLQRHQRGQRPLLRERHGRGSLPRHLHGVGKL